MTSERSESGLHAILEVQLQTFFTGLSEGLHAAAQPLTILRALWESEFIDEMSESELRRSAVNSAEQVECLCKLLSYLQQMLEHFMIAPHLQVIETCALLDDASDGLRLLIEDAGVSLRKEVSESCAVIVDPLRMRQALSEAMLIAFRLSKTADTIELSAATFGDKVRVTVRNTHSGCDLLKTQLKLAFAVTEVNLRSQGGELSYSSNPLTIRMDLPTTRCQFSREEGISQFRKVVG